MLAPVWHKKLSASVIDCHYDAATDTVSACDTNGLAVIFDSDAVLHSQVQVEMPAWGVAHLFRGNGDAVLLVAEARKADDKGNRQAGGLSVFDGTDLRLRIPFDEPCWDVIASHDSAWLSTWGGQVVRLGLDARSADEAVAIDVGGPAYGLSAPAEDDDPRLLACVAGHGVLELDPRAGRVGRTLVAAPSAGYNVATRGGAVLAGSTSAGFAVVRAGDAVADLCPVALRGQASAVAVVADDFLLVGDLDGSLALFHVDRLDSPLAGMRLPEGIWNLACDAATDRIYVACGDGHLYALEISLGPDLSRDHVHEVRAAVTRQPFAAADLLGAATSVSDVSIALVEIDDAWSDYSHSDIASLAKVLKRWSVEHPSARLFYRLGLAEMEDEAWDDAIVALQRIDQASDTYAASLLPLADAFDRIGSPRTAVNVLKANLERFPSSALLDVLFKIGTLSEKSSDRDGALTAYETVSFHDHAYPGVQEALSRLRPLQAEPPAVTVASGGALDITSDAREDTRLGSRRRLAYDQISYIQYEYGPPADEAKKLLEEHVMGGVIARSFARPGRSLDIGCATGRWPIWFARRGWTASGYDIAADAIDICRRRAAQMPAGQPVPDFHQHNICDGAIEVEAFDLVSTMMGTFNHIPHDLLGTFLRGIWDSLAPGGTLAFTSWNAQSRFCDFLNLDGERAKEDLRRNCLEGPRIVGFLEAAGFEQITSVPMVFLPNACYDVWEDDLERPAESFVELDDVLRRHVAPNKAQMHFYVATKRRA